MNKLFFAVAVCALAVATSQVQAGTIIKLTLGEDDAPDIEFSGGAGGILSTTDDTNGSTAGDQNTSAEFLDVLDSAALDILTNTASVTLDGITAQGNALVIGSNLVLQNFQGGTLELYDAANVLLLSGTLDASSLIGAFGPPATGGVITTTFGQFTGGTLSPYLDPSTLALSISLANINDGSGLSVTPAPPPPPPQNMIYDGGELDAFVADATMIISGDPIPEPATVATLLAGGALAGFAIRRRR